MVLNIDQCRVVPLRHATDDPVELLRAPEAQPVPILRVAECVACGDRIARLPLEPTQCIPDVGRIIVERE